MKASKSKQKADIERLAGILGGLRASCDLFRAATLDELRKKRARRRRAASRRTRPTPSALEGQILVLVGSPLSLCIVTLPASAVEDSVSFVRRKAAIVP